MTDDGKAKATRRRGGGGGNIEKRGPGRYRVRSYRGRDASGKIVFESRTVRGTRREAEAVLRELEAARDRGATVAATGMTVDAYLDKWLAEAAPLRLRARTLRDYKYTLKRYVRPYVGRKKLSRLSPADVQAMVNALAEQGLGRTVRMAHVVLSSALSRAVKWNLIAYNPCRNVELPSERAQERRGASAAMSVEQLRAFLAAVRGTRYEALFVAMVGTGLRPSELLGLQWEDVDLEHGLLAVRRTLPRGWRRWVREGQEPFEAPKTRAGARTVGLAAPVVAALRAHRARQAQDRLVAGSGWQDPWGLVFTTTRGRPLTWEDMRARHFKPALERAGIDPAAFRGYDLRHSYATQALAAGTSVRELQERLGHSDVSVTLGTYVHVLEEQRRETTDKIAARLFGEAGTQ